MKNLLLLLGIAVFVLAGVLMLPRPIDFPSCRRLAPPPYDPAVRTASETGRPNALARHVGQAIADRLVCD